MNDRWARVEAIVHQALARPAAERQAFVRETCGTDRELCDEVMSLIEEDAAAESFLAVPAAALEPSMVGRTIGIYRIDARIGGGGMGVVYRGRDTRLQRDVAVKILPAAVANDPHALARLGREARLLAALNHPRVAAIHGLEETGEIRALVMELLDGESLAQRIARGPLSVTDACRLAAQIADGLGAAHDKGIVHRDLKPANVQITSGGNVKLLDFGIAKPMFGELTGTTIATRPGAVIGTAAFMSPEQLRGENVDRQTDVWAFGCVMFEMLSGAEAFVGKTTSDIVAAVLEHEPEWSALPASVPQQIKMLIRRCLAKDKSQRLRDMGDVRIALEDGPALQAIDPVIIKSALAGAQVRTAARVAALVIVAALAVGIPLGKWRASAPTLPAPPTTMKLWLPPGTTWGTDVPRLTRGGRRVAASLIRNGVSSIFVLDLDGGTWRPVAGTEGGQLAFLSPDGNDVAFIRDNALMRVNVDRGAPAKICDGGDAIRGGDWAEDGRIVIGLLNRGLAIVPSAGGVPVSMTTPDPSSSESDHRYPIWLPGAKSVLFTVQNKDVGAANIAVASVGVATHRIVIPGGRSPAFIDGHLVYVDRADELRAVAFDPDGLVAGTQSFALAERPGSGQRTSDTAIRTSGADIVYVPADDALYHFEYKDERGSEQLRMPPQPIKGVVAASPNGERVVFEAGIGQSVDLVLYDLRNDNLVFLTKDRNSRSPRWAGNNRLVFHHRGERSQMFTLTLDASGQPEGAPKPIGELGGFPMFVDGEDLVYTTDDSSSDLSRASFDNADRPERLLASPRNQWGAVLSPDRKWLAYLSNELGEPFDLFISRYITPVQPRRVVQGVRWIRWSRQSNDLFYVKGSTLFVVKIDEKGSLGIPATVMSLTWFSNSPGQPMYDTLPKGRLLVAVPEPQPEDARTPILVLNWTTRLREALAKK